MPGVTITIRNEGTNASRTVVTAASGDYSAPLLPPGLPAPAARFTGLAKYSFVGGNNDPDGVPVDELVAAVTAVLKREGKSLATVKAGGAQIIDVDKAPFQAAMKPVYDKFITDAKLKDLVKRVQDTK